jgi:hypothetical protein
MQSGGFAETLAFGSGQPPPGLIMRIGNPYCPCDNYA